jgi:hypothetical protein
LQTHGKSKQITNENSLALRFMVHLRRGFVLPLYPNANSGFRQWTLAAKVCKTTPAPDGEPPVEPVGAALAVVRVLQCVGALRHATARWRGKFK